MRVVYCGDASQANDVGGKGDWVCRFEVCGCGGVAVGKMDLGRALLSGVAGPDDWDCCCLAECCDSDVAAIPFAQCGVDGGSIGVEASVVEGEC